MFYVLCNYINVLEAHIRHAVETNFPFRENKVFSQTHKHMSKQNVDILSNDFKVKQKEQKNKAVLLSQVVKNNIKSTIQCEQVLLSYKLKTAQIKNVNDKNEQIKHLS